MTESTNILVEAPPSSNFIVTLWRRAHSASQFGTNVLVTLGATAIISFIGLVTGPISARLLGPAGRGELAAIQNLYWVMGTMSLLGLHEATVYFIARSRHEEARVLATSLVLVLLCCPAFFLVAYGCAPILLAAQSSSVVSAARWFVLGLPLYAFYQIPLGVFRGRNAMVQWNMLRVVAPIGWLTVLFAAHVLVKSSVTFVAAGYLCSIGVSSVMTAVALKRGAVGSLVPDPNQCKPLLKYGLPLACATIPVTLNLRLDQMLMGALLPAKSLGLYVVAVSWSGLVTPGLVAIGMALFPRVAAAQTDEARSRFLAQVIRISAAVAVLLAVFVGSLTSYGLPLLFGRAFLESVPVAFVLVFAAGVSGLNVILEDGLRGMGHTSAVLKSETVGLLLTALCLGALLKPLGILGAGIASMMGYTGTMFTLVYWVRKTSDLSLRSLMLPRSEDFALAKEMARRVTNSIA